MGIIIGIVMIYTAQTSGIWNGIDPVRSGELALAYTKTMQCFSSRIIRFHEVDG